MATFSDALKHLKKGGEAKRVKVKNDTVIVLYKNRLYQMSKTTGIRYSYIPTNKDILSNDWEMLAINGEVGTSVCSA